MLETCPPALCPHEPRVPRKSHGHPWLCSFRREATAVRYGVTSAVSVAPDAADSATSRATYLKSSPCTNACVIIVKSNTCEKSRGAPPPNLATQGFRAAKLSKTGVSARRFPARSRSELWNVQTRQLGSQSPLESALTPKWGWGVPPPGRFLR